MESIFSSGFGNLTTDMKLKQTTIEAITNLGKINDGLVIHKGKRLRSQDNLNKVIAYIDIEDEFPRTFGVYDVKEFLKAIKLVKDPEFEFEETHVLITNGEGTELIFQYANMEFVTEAPEKLIFPSLESKASDNSFLYTSEDFIDFTINYETIEQVIKACKTLGLQQIRIHSEEASETLSISAFDGSGASKHKFKVPLAQFDSKRVVETVIHFDRFTMLPKGDYSVSIHVAGISQFKNDTHTYYLATEAV